MTKPRAAWTARNRSRIAASLKFARPQGSPAARRAGANPLLEVRHARLNRELVRETTARHARLVRDVELFRMRKMQAYAAIRGSSNATENADVPGPLTKL